MFCEKVNVKHNEYLLIRGKHLKELKLEFAPVINVGSKIIIYEDDYSEELKLKIINAIKDTNYTD